MTAPHMLPSTSITASAPAMLKISWLNPTPHTIAVYASPSPSPATTQHSLAGGRYPLPAPVFHRQDRASLAWRTIDPFLPFKFDPTMGRNAPRETLPDFVHLAARATPRGSDYSRRTGSDSPIDVTIRRPRERPFGAPLGGKAITFPTPPAIRTAYIAWSPMRFPIGIIGKLRLGHCHIRENYLPRDLIA